MGEVSGESAAAAAAVHIALAGLVCGRNLYSRSPKEQQGQSDYRHRKGREVAALEDITVSLPRKNYTNKEKVPSAAVLDS